MNNLLTESFERIRGRFPGEGGSESRNGFSPDARDLEMEGFFKQVGEIEKKMEKITTQLHKLEDAHEESKTVTRASAMKAIKERMEKDVDEVKKISLRIKIDLEGLDQDNLSHRQKPGCGKGTVVDRSRMAMTVALKQKLKEQVSKFQALRQSIQEEYREVVERRVFTVTGTRPCEETIDHLIETGNSEQIFEKAIQGHGRGEIMATFAEIQERHDTVFEIERKILDLQQMFLDMSVLVDAQGDMLNDIEAQVTSSIDHVEMATQTLKHAKKLQKNTRKYMCIAIIILLIVMAVVLVAVLKGIKQA